jgi:hypothetical protein
VVLLATILVVVVDLVEKRELDAHFEIANSATTPTTPRALLSTDPGEEQQQVQSYNKSTFGRRRLSRWVSGINLLCCYSTEEGNKKAITRRSIRTKGLLCPGIRDGLKYKRKEDKKNKSSSTITGVC